MIKFLPGTSAPLCWRLILWVLAPAITYLTVMPVAAKPAVRLTAYQRCMEKSQYLYTDDVRRCSDLEYQRANILLYNAFREALAGLPPDGKKALKRSEAVWRKRTRIECDNDPNIVESKGGTIWPILYTDCFTTKFKARTKWLKTKV